MKVHVYSIVLIALRLLYGIVSFVHVELQTWVSTISAYQMREFQLIILMLRVVSCELKVGERGARRIIDVVNIYICL